MTVRHTRTQTHIHRCERSHACPELWSTEKVSIPGPTSVKQAISESTRIAQQRVLQWSHSHPVITCTFYPPISCFINVCFPHSSAFLSSPAHSSPMAKVRSSQVNVWALKVTLNHILKSHKSPPPEAFFDRFRFTAFYYFGPVKSDLYQNLMCLWIPQGFHESTLWTPIQRFNWLKLVSHFPSHTLETPQQSLNHLRGHRWEVKGLTSTCWYLSLSIRLGGQMAEVGLLWPC